MYAGTFGEIVEDSAALISEGVAADGHPVFSLPMAIRANARSAASSQSYAHADAYVAASPALVYGLLRDYRDLPGAAMPRGYFAEVACEERGVGAGTIFNATISLRGILLHRYVEVSEPAPMTLVEKDLHSRMVTTISVEPQGKGTRVRYTTHTPSKLIGAAPSAAMMRLLHLAQLEVLKMRAEC